MRLSTNKPSVQAYQPLELGVWNLELSPYLEYVSNAPSPKNVLSTSFRSESHATDSTCNGCNANNAATNAAAHIFSVIRINSRNNTSAFAACSQTLTRCCLPASESNRLASSICESHVSGCQLLACHVVNAH